MAKLPRAGAVKTRLARDIGTSTATNFYRHSLTNLIRRLENDNRWQTIIAVAPGMATYDQYWGHKTKHARLIAQANGDLGQKMQALFDRLPTGPVIIIGTDIPSISASIIARAFEALKGYDAIIGPSEDGGYWLVGQSRTRKSLNIFKNVRWSTEFTRNDTLTNLEGKRVARTNWLTDVDDGDDYRSLKNEAARVILPPKECSALNVRDNS